MVKTYATMSFAEKAIYHTQKAEEYQRRAEFLEDAANDRSTNAEVAALLLAKDDRLAFPYKQATGSRNGHQQQAIMYGIVALLEKLST